MNLKLKTAIAACLITGLTAAAVAEESISVSPGSEREGSLTTRNESIYVGAQSTIGGSLKSRNGRVETAESVTAGDVSTRNGRIMLGEDGRYGNVDSRNGNVTIGERTQVEAVDTRNGSITIGMGAQTRSLDSRNGAVRVGGESIVDGSVTTRNGEVSAFEDALVAGQIVTRNGDIGVKGASIEQGLRSRSGDISVDESAEILGEVTIQVDEPNNSGWFGLGGSDWPEAGDIRILGGSHVAGNVSLDLPSDYDEDAPTVEFGDGVRIDGSIRIDSRAELIVADGLDLQIELVEP